MSEMFIKIAPDGTHAFSLYDDETPLKELGPLEMIRASNVVWNIGKQCWVIEVERPDGKMNIPIDFKSRTEAIEFEKKALPTMMLRGDGVEWMFQKQKAR